MPKLSQILQLFPYLILISLSIYFSFLFLLLLYLFASVSECMGICDEVDSNGGNGGLGYLIGEVEKYLNLDSLFFYFFLKKIRLCGDGDFIISLEMRL